MGKVTVLEETTKNPITLMGKRAGICWGADIKDDKKNYKRGLDCLNSGHGRVMEFVNVEMVLDGYSARVIREWYTHVISATRLQSSTRYINYNDFDFVTPKSIKNNKDNQAWKNYMDAINQIKDSCSQLELLDIPREDIGMLLPLCMITKIVDKRNLRSLIDMSHQRLCSRAYWEYRDMMKDVMNQLSNYSNEWKYLVDNYFKPKCEVQGYCTENKSCGKMKKMIDK